MQKRLYFLAGIIGEFILVGVFAKALIDPENNLDFIYSVAPIIFVMEFLSAHSAFLLTSTMAKNGKSPAFLLIPMYGFFVLILTLSSGSIWPAIAFIVSLTSRVLFAKASPSKDRKIIRTMLILVGTIFFVAIFSEIIKEVITFPEDSVSQTSEVISQEGSFVGAPFIVWGLIYYSITIVMEYLDYKPIKPGVIKNYSTHVSRKQVKNPHTIIPNQRKKRR